MYIIVLRTATSRRRERGRREREETRKRVREGERKTMTGDRIANDGYKGAGPRVV